MTVTVPLLAPEALAGIELGDTENVPSVAGGIGLGLPTVMALPSGSLTVTVPVKEGATPTRPVIGTLPPTGLLLGGVTPDGQDSVRLMLLGAGLVAGFGETLQDSCCDTAEAPRAQEKLSVREGLVMSIEPVVPPPEKPAGGLQVTVALPVPDAVAPPPNVMVVAAALPTVLADPARVTVVLACGDETVGAWLTGGAGVPAGQDRLNTIEFGAGLTAGLGLTPQVTVPGTTAAPRVQETGRLPPVVCALNVKGLGEGLPSVKPADAVQVTAVLPAP